MNIHLSTSKGGRRSGICIALAVLVLAALAPAAFAQADLGTITGTIVDQSASAIPGAKVTLVEVSTGTTREVVSNVLGIVNLPSVIPGAYTLSVTAAGFRDKKMGNLVVNGYQELSLGLVELEVGSGPATEVTVTAQQQLVKDSAIRTDTVQSIQITSMPNNGRNWATMMKIIPGSTAVDDSGMTGREYGYYNFMDFSVNGKAIGQTQVNLDGAGIVDHGSDGKTDVSPSLESIEEISFLTNNFTAEYGNRAGVSINIVTKSGTNQFHGVAFENFRNEDLNANSWVNSYTGLPPTKYRYNYFGADLGGPIRKNKLFFFYNFEDFNSSLPGTALQSRVPTALERAGDFSQTVNANGTRPAIYEPGTQYAGAPIPFPNNLIPPSMINPLGQAMMNLYPLPNNPNNPNLNYNLVYQTKHPRLSEMGKGDWNINDSTRAFARYSQDQGVYNDLGIYNTTAPLPFNFMNQSRTDQNAAVNVTHTFSSSVVLEALVGWMHEYSAVSPANPNLVESTKVALSGLPTAFPVPATESSPGGVTVPANLLPGINSGGIYPTFNFNRLPSINVNYAYQAAATLTWLRGSHAFKFGFQSYWNLEQLMTSVNNKGTYDFSPSHSPFDTNYGPSNMLLGAVGEFTQVSSIALQNSVYLDTQVFAQDTWKATRSLTVNYGLRVYHMPAERDRNPSAEEDAVFLPNMWNPAQAPRYYIPNPNNPQQVIDPANPGNPMASSLASQLLYTIVPGSGNPRDGVYAIGSPQAGSTGLLAPNYLLFAPRGGIAWSPKSDPKMVIRGGFGWAYNRNGTSDAISYFNNGLTQTADYLQTSLATLATGPARISPASFEARDPSSRKAQTVYDYSVGVQHELPFKMVMDVAYVGNIQRHQAIDFNLNAIPPGTAFLPQYVDSTNVGYNFAGPITASNPGALPGSNAMNALVMRPYQGLNTLTATENVGNNRYDSFQASLNKRFGSGLMFGAALTISRLISGVDSPGLSCCNWKSYTNHMSNTARPYTLPINYVYSIPSLAKALGFGNAVTDSIFDDWQFAHLLAFYGGQPYTPSFNIQEANTTTNVNTSLVLLGTPDLTPRSTIAGSLNGTNSNQLFNPLNLGIPAIGSIGNGPRNYLTAPGTFSNDMTMTKQFRILEGKTIEFRVAAYNVFNQVRRTYVNSSVLYKAQGAQYSNGFAVYNLPSQLAQEAAASGITNSQAIYNQYITGAGAPTLTNVQPMRILELALRFRF